MKIQNVSDAAFKKYGKVITGLDCSDIIAAMAETPCPENGSEQDIENGKYDTSKVEAFLVPAGTVIEVYATTLHYAPCNANDGGFKCVVALPKGTNTDIEKRAPKTEEDKMLFARNKWLLMHPEAAEEGQYVGLVGENICV